MYFILHIYLKNTNIYGISDHQLGHKFINYECFMNFLIKNYGDNHQNYNIINMISTEKIII